MGKIKELTIDEKDGNVAVEPIVLTHTAISMANTPGEGWSLIKIRYNPITGDVGKAEKKYTGEIRAYIEEKFRIETVTDNIFNNGDVRF